MHARYVEIALVVGAGSWRITGLGNDWCNKVVIDQVQARIDDVPWSLVSLHA